MRATVIMRSWGIYSKTLLLIVMTVVLLSSYHRFSSTSKHGQTLHVSRSSVDATTLSSSTFNGTKGIALPFGTQNYRPDFSAPQSFHHQTKRDDEQEESKAFCTGVLLYAKIQAAFSGFPSRAPSFSKADIKNGWTVVDTLNELGLDDRWHLPYQSISGGQTPENKGARDVLAFQGEPFVNKIGERITVRVPPSPSPKHESDE